jgi:hypothetical protein
MWWRGRAGCDISVSVSVSCRRVVGPVMALSLGPEHIRNRRCALVLDAFQRVIKGRWGDKYLRVAARSAILAAVAVGPRKYRIRALRVSSQTNSWRVVSACSVSVLRTGTSARPPRVASRRMATDGGRQGGP